ncbi:GTPase activator, partial [Rhizoctonia solani]
MASLCRFYKTGHEDGFQHGRIHGLIEGRALGREKGFEMWEELGFYEGFAGVWIRVAAKPSSDIDERAIHHAEQLVLLISKFPMTNPPVSPQAESQIDIVRLYTQIRSRYKALCSTLGFRPRLVSAGAVPSDPSGSGEGGNDLQGDVQSSGRPIVDTAPNPQSKMHSGATSTSHHYPTMLKAGHSRTPSKSTVKSPAIKFTDPFSTQIHIHSMDNKSVTTRPASLSNGIHRRNTVAVDPSRPPRPIRGSILKVNERPMIGKTTHGAQFEMVTPPRSPKDVSPQDVRLPLRARSAEPSNGMRRTSTVTRGLRPRQQNVAAHRLKTATVSTALKSRSSLIPIRKDMSVLGWAESQATFRALTGNQSRRDTSRVVLPDEWTLGTAPQRPNLNWRSTGLSIPPEPMVEAEHRRVNSEPEVKPNPDAYPQLTSGEQVILVRKLRVLLKCAGINDRALDAWEESSIKESTLGNPGGVFGRSVKDSSPYASCQVVLGEHSHTLPICVFASVEEICQRGIATPGLFCVAPPPSERTLEKLACTFDQGPSYGVKTSLAKEGISNVCALLRLYLRGLPEAVLSNWFWPIIQRLTLIENSDMRITSAQTAAIQAILHLQHPTSFSLLVYLLAFLHQLALHGSQNGLSIPILAGIFGPALFSPRKGNAVRAGCVISPPPENQVLVKTFQSVQDVAEGTRVMTWVLEHWDGIATGLLSLDIVHGSEKGIQAWEANLFRDPLVVFRGESDGQYSEGLSTNEVLEPGPDNLLVCPEMIMVDRVPVHEVRNSTVKAAEIPPFHSTRTSSPATLWSQETGPNPIAVSRTTSLEANKTYSEPIYVRELRRRLDTQEDMLGSLRQELALIRSRFVFPLPPDDTSSKTKDSIIVDEPNTINSEMEDTMQTPRPPSASQCPEFSTINELMDSLESNPVTLLFHKTVLDNIPDIDSEQRSTISTSPTAHSRGSPESSSTSDLSPGTPLNEPAQGSLYIANPDLAPSESTESRRDGGKLEELITARDALKSALAAMDPVKVQLKAVEEELEHRGMRAIS